MYDKTRQEFTLRDASGSYSWLVEGLEREIGLDDHLIYAMIDQQIDISKEYDQQKVSAWADQGAYPRYGYTLAQVYNTPEEYIVEKYQEIDDDYARDREEAFEFVKDWFQDDGSGTGTIDDDLFEGVDEQAIQEFLTGGASEKEDETGA